MPHHAGASMNMFSSFQGYLSDGKVVQVYFSIYVNYIEKEAFYCLYIEESKLKSSKQEAPQNIHGKKLTIFLSDISNFYYNHDYKSISFDPNKNKGPKNVSKLKTATLIDTIPKDRTYINAYDSVIKEQKVMSELTFAPKQKLNSLDELCISLPKAYTNKKLQYYDVGLKITANGGEKTLPLYVRVK